MSAQGWILVATAVLAVVAIGAAVVAVMAVRRLGRAQQSVPATPETTTPGADVAVRDPAVHRPVVTILPPELEPRVVDGRLVVPPTQQQVVQAALGRPGVRLSILAHGVAHALRAESRDRISALMRREYRRRRRERQRAARRAARLATPATPTAQTAVPRDERRAS